MKTDFNTLRALASYTINHLLERKYVQFNIGKRTELIEALATELGVSFSTDDDIREQAIEEVEDKLGEVDVEDITETEMFNHARKEIIKGFHGESIGGLYMVESLHQIGVRIKDFLMDCDLIEDVFATDNELIDFLVTKIRKFSPKRG